LTEKCNTNLHVPKKVRIGMQRLFHITIGSPESGDVQTTRQFVNTALVRSQIRSDGVDLSSGRLWTFVEE
jgi:hypothetical protein